MILSTLCYIEKDGCWLMLHRVKNAMIPVADMLDRLLRGEKAYTQ